MVERYLGKILIVVMLKFTWIVYTQLIVKISFSRNVNSKIP